MADGVEKKSLSMAAAVIKNEKTKEKAVWMNLLPPLEGQKKRIGKGKLWVQAPKKHCVGSLALGPRWN